MSIIDNGDGSNGGDDKQELKRPQVRAPCLEMLLRCNCIETMHAAACVSIIGNGNGIGCDSGDGDDDAQELERRQVRAPLR